jgi:hypothetical protein
MSFFSEFRKKMIHRFHPSVFSFLLSEGRAEEVDEVEEVESCCELPTSWIRSRTGTAVFTEQWI